MVPDSALLRLGAVQTDGMKVRLFVARRGPATLGSSIKAGRVDMSALGILDSPLIEIGLGR